MFEQKLAEALNILYAYITVYSQEFTSVFIMISLIVLSILIAAVVKLLVELVYKGIVWLVKKIFFKRR